MEDNSIGVLTYNPFNRGIKFSILIPDVLYTHLGCQVLVLIGWLVRAY